MARLAITNRTLASTGTEIETWLQQFGVDGVAIDNTTGKYSVLIKNGGGGGATITVDVPSTVDGNLVVPDRTFSVGAGEYWLIKPFDRSVYNQDDSADSGIADNAVLLDSSVTDGSVEITAFKY